MLQDVFSLLTREEKRGWIRAILAVAANTVLDFFGIASLLPLLYYLMGDGANRRAALFFGGIAVAFILLKSVAGIWLQRRRTKFLNALFCRLSMSLYRDSFSRGLEFVRNHGASRIAHEVTWVCDMFCRNLLGSMLQMAGDVLLLLLTGGVVLVMAPVSALVLALPLAVVVVAYWKVAGERVRKEGERELQERKRVATLVNDTFGGFPDVMTSGAYPFLESEFDTRLHTLGRIRRNMEMDNASVLPLCELAVAVSLSAMAFIGQGDGARLALGLFAVAAFRVIPAVRGLVSGWIRIRNASPALDTLRRLQEGEEKAADGAEPAPGQPQSHQKADDASKREVKRGIEIRNLSFSYIADGRKIMQGFSQFICRGEYVGIRGSSGVGKSTFLYLLLGMLRPESGSVAIDGVTADRCDHDEWLRHFAYVAQDVFVFHDTVAANIAAGDANPRRERVVEVLHEVCLDDWLAGLPDGIDTMLGERGMTLSGGERQRLGLARALYRDAPVLLLDEATSALDSKTESGILTTIEQVRRSRDLTVVSIAHRDSSLIYCNRIINMEAE